VYYTADKLLSKGRRKWTQYYRGTMFTRAVNLHFFPFDYQVTAAAIESKLAARDSTDELRNNAALS
jgi:hypothetical protein